MSRRSRIPLLALVVALSFGCGGEDGDGWLEAVRDLSGEQDLVEQEREDLDPIPGGEIPSNARDDQVEAVERANWHRYHSGLPPLDMIDAINRAAQAHCDFYANHIDKYKSSGLSPHNEEASWGQGFTGVSPWDRMGHFGYGGGASEVIAFVRNPTQAVDGWMNTLYHRIPFMNATLTACGYGAAGSGTWQNSSKIDTMDFGWNDADGNPYSGPEIEGIYPPPGSSGIPPSFDGMESPQPPVPPGGYPSGTIISVTWSSTANFQAQEHEIWKDGSQQKLAHVWVDGGNDANLAGANTIAMYANAPLEDGTRYWVRIKGMKNGAPWEKQWFFYTARY